ncbi:MAG: S-layer homology domain-containing protein [Clostridia bacterium]|nr:S-layer homology domain-containing protein [Clostridia bacterium]
MNTKKRILTLALCVVYMFSAAVFAAAETTPEALTVDITVIDSVAGTLKISGTAPGAAAGEGVTLLVTNKDVNNDDNNDMEDIEANIAARVQYQNAAVTKANGYFEFVFTLNMDTAIADSEDDSYTFDIYAGGAAYDGEVATASYWLAAEDTKLAAAKEVVEAADDAAAGALIEENKEEFAVDGAVFAELDKEELAALLRSKLAADLFAGYTAGNEADYLDEYSAFDAALRLCIAIEGFNQDIAASLNGTAIVYDEILGLTDYIETEGTLNTIYTTKLTTAGVSAALNGIFNNDADDEQDLCEAFAKEILVQGIRRNKDSGYGIVEKVLTADNLAAAGLDVVSVGNDTLKTEYLDHANIAAVNNDIYNERATITAENLEAKIIASAKKDYTVNNPGTDTGTSGNTGSVSVGVGGTTTPVSAFIDLGGYDWAKTAIISLADKGIINGVGNQRFNPAGTLTREQAAKIICLTVGIEPSYESTAFADVDPSAWYAPYIAALSKAGIINGVSETAFGIGNNVTREDFAVMICRALNYSAVGEANFADKADISAYAADAVNALYEQGIVGGYEDGSFRPKANISRAEGAKIIYGILSK